MKIFLRIGMLCWLALAVMAMDQENWAKGAFYALMLIAATLQDRETS